MFAWKPTTHVYLGEVALKDALDNGMVTIERLDPVTGKITGVIGEYAVDAAVLAALKKNADQYRAGILGPDAYPDILTGQQVIHPPTNPDGTNRWLEYLWSNSDGSPEIKAFVTGYLTHAAGDMYGHTFINNFTGGAFTFKPVDNAKKHILLESYIAKRVPDPTFASSIVGVEDLIYKKLVDARPGTYLDKELLVKDGEGTDGSIPRVYSTLRAELEADIVKLTADAKKCKPWNPKCSAVLLKAEAKYKKAWIDDIDKGLKAWVTTSDEVAKALFFNPEKKTDTDKAQAIINDYVNRHLISMSGPPDAVGTLAILSGKIQDIIIKAIPDELAEPVKQFKRDLYDVLIKRATGMSAEEFKRYSTDPETHFDTEMTKGQGQLINRSKFDTDMLFMTPTDKTIDYKNVGAAYDTVVMSKLLLLSKDSVNKLLADLGSKNRLEKPDIMLGFIKTLDGDNQQAGMVLGRDCRSYRQVFMRFAGERICPPTP
ncbi:MAG: hypothetical protein ABL952_01355 [Pyrinomonadaceae bacterium]